MAIENQNEPEKRYRMKVLLYDEIELRLNKERENKLTSNRAHVGPLLFCKLLTKPKTTQKSGENQNPIHEEKYAQLYPFSSIYLSIDDNRDKRDRPNMCVTHFEQSTYFGGVAVVVFLLVFVFISLPSY